MSEAALNNLDPAAGPARRGSPDKNIGLEVKGNFNCVVEFMGAPSEAHQNARRGK